MPCRVCIPLYFCFYFEPGSVYIGKYPERGEISADVIWGKKYEKGKEDKEETVRKKGERQNIKGSIEVKG
jgi:hypothetical protein